MKCAESLELRHAFVNVVFTRLVKGPPRPEGSKVSVGESTREIEGCPYRIPINPEVRDPEDPWAIKEEMLLEDAIAANISQAEKNKKCRVVYRTHGIGSTHHARLDGIPASTPTIAPQGLAILLADAATQTEVADKEVEPHPRLQRSISLPPFYRLEWK
ncbi:hypothetical protein Tco_1541464 [Tanacetum coccineum]